MRTFQIEIWKILEVLNGRGLVITDEELINKELDFFNKFQDNETKLSLRTEKVVKQNKLRRSKDEKKKRQT